MAPILEALGADILYSTRGNPPEARGRRVDLDQLLEASDIVSLHLPLSEGTRGVIDRARIHRMKPGSILINTARGGFVDQDALLEALRSGHLAGAGLDVFALEPVPAENPLFSLQNVVATPYVAWLAMETFERSLELMAENCRRLKADEPLLHRVV